MLDMLPSVSSPFHSLFRNFQIEGSEYHESSAVALSEFDFTYSPDFRSSLHWLYSALPQNIGSEMKVSYIQMEYISFISSLL